MAPFQSVLLVCPGRWLIFLALSSAFCQVMVRRLLSSLWFGWCFCYLPCGPAPGLSLDCWPFLRFFSQGSSLCASWTLGFSIPLPIPSSWAPLSRFSSSAAFSSPRYSRWRLDPAFLLLWCAFSYSLSRLVSCFCFLGRLFRTLSKFQDFLSSFLPLVSVGLSLGLQLFLVFLSFPLLGFPVTSSHCGVSHFLTWSLFLSVPRFLVPGWFVLRPLRWCSAISSCSPAFSGLADPFYFSSPALSFALFLGALLFEFSSFSPLVLYASFSFCCRAPGLLVASVRVFLLSPVGLWVLQGLRVLPCPCVQGYSSQGILVLCLRFVSVRLPSFPAPQVSYGLVVVFP